MALEVNGVVFEVGQNRLGVDRADHQGQSEGGDSEDEAEPLAARVNAEKEDRAEEHADRFEEGVVDDPDARFQLSWNGVREEVEAVVFDGEKDAVNSDEAENCKSH